MQLNQVLRACNYEIDEGAAGAEPFKSGKTRTLSLCGGKVHCTFSQASRVTLEIRVHPDANSPATWVWRDSQFPEKPQTSNEGTQGARRVHSTHEALALLEHMSHADGKDLVDTQLDLSEDVLLELYTQAHQKDMTLNELVNHVMQEMVERHKQASLAANT